MPGRSEVVESPRSPPAALALLMVSLAEPEGDPLFSYEGGRIDITLNHALDPASGRNRRQRFWLVFAASALRRFAADCQRLQPRGSIKRSILVGLESQIFGGLLQSSISAAGVAGSPVFGVQAR